MLKDLDIFPLDNPKHLFLLRKSPKSGKIVNIFCTHFVHSLTKAKMCISTVHLSQHEWQWSHSLQDYITPLTESNPCHLQPDSRTSSKATDHDEACRHSPYTSLCLQVSQIKILLRRSLNLYSFCSNHKNSLIKFQWFATNIFCHNCVRQQLD